MYVGLDPATVGPNNYVWKGTQKSSLVNSIQVKTTDSNFHYGTMYYVYIKATSASDAVISLVLTQQLSTSFLTNNHDSIFLQTSAYYNKAMLFLKH
jgi:hypothetical protein